MAKTGPPLKPKKTRNGPRVTPTAIDHNPDAQHVAGEAERRILFQEFCFHLATKGYPETEIAGRLAIEFNLERVPSRSMVNTLIREAVQHKSQKIAQMREVWLPVNLARLEQVVRNFLPTATGNGTGAPLLTLRKKDFYGEEVEVIDEDAMKEQSKAAEVVLKAIEQGRRMLGIGLKDDGGDGDAITPAQVNTLIVQTVHQHYAGPGGQKTIGAVTLQSGDATIEALEG